MNISLNNLRISNLPKNSILILCVIVVAIMIGLTIADGNLVYAGAIFIPVVIYICIIKPFIFPFGAYVFLLPFDEVLSIMSSAGSATLTKYLGILSMLILLLKGVFEKKLRRPDNTAYLWIPFIVYVGLSLLWAIKSDDILFSRMPTIVGLVTLYLIAASYKSQKSDFDTLKVCILLGGLFAAVFVIYNFTTGHTERTGFRATLEVAERSINQNRVAFTLLIPISVCIQMIIENKNKVKKVLLFSALMIILFSSMITGSRGGLLGTGAIFITYILSMKKRISYGTIFVILAIILLSLSPSYVIERWSEAVDTGGAGRTTIWYVGLKALEKYWAFGAGLNNFPNAYDEFAFNDLSKGWSWTAHNIYLETLVEFGITGFSLMALAIVKHYKAIRSRFDSYNSNSIMLKASVWGVMLSSFFISSFWFKSFWLLWMLIIMYKYVVDGEIAA